MFACGSKTDPSSKRAPEGSAAAPVASSGSASAVKPRDGKIDLAPTTRPIPSPSPAPVPTAETAGPAFEAQQRDAQWAPAIEAEIQHRFETGVKAGHLDSAECRTDQCLLTMSGSEEEMGKALAKLETEGGLRSFADHIILAGPETRDGTMIVKAYAVFDRKTER